VYRQKADTPVSGEERGSLIRFKDVTFTYESHTHTDERPIINRINATLRKGEYVAVVGPNGSGKSTLAKLMNGLLLPVEGEVIVAERSTRSTEQLYHIRRQVGLVFQNPENQMVANTVYDDVGFGLENIGFSPERMPDVIEQALRKVDMWSHRHKEPHHLSGGQKQRVAIAGMIAMQPDVLILDEATSMLDPEGRKQVLAAISALHREGMAVVHITHDMEEALLAGRLWIMNEGRITYDGEPRELLGNPEQLLQAHLAPPFVSYAQAQLAAHGVQIPETVTTEKEMIEALWTYTFGT
jgi:energy-coupling factor transport system ATP-binding protein